MKFIFSFIILVLASNISAQSFISKPLEKGTNDIILSFYHVPEVSKTHAEENGKINELFLYLFKNHKKMSQKQKNQYAAKAFKLFYDEVNLGMLEDSPDLRRQSMRAAMLLSCVAICNRDNYTYYLDLALLHLKDFSDEPIDYMEDEFLSQLLVNIAVCNLKGDEVCARGYLLEYFNSYKYLANKTTKPLKIKETFEKLDVELPKLEK